MRRFTVLFGCLICVGSGRRLGGLRPTVEVELSSAQASSSGTVTPSKAFASLILAADPRLAFKAVSFPSRHYTRSAVQTRAGHAPAMTETKDQFMSTMLSGERNADEQRLLLNELLLKLERSNPTPSPASSALLNGVWELQFAGGLAPGAVTFSPTREIALALYSSTAPSAVLNFLSAGPFSSLPSPLETSVSDVGVTIESADMGQPRVTTELEVSLFGAKSTVLAFSNLTPDTDVRLRQEFVEAEAFGQRGLLPGPLALSRSLFVTYLDEDLLVVRDDSGVPEVLVRKSQLDPALRSDASTEDANSGPIEDAVEDDVKDSPSEDVAEDDVKDSPMDDATAPEQTEEVDEAQVEDVAASEQIGDINEAQVEDVVEDVKDSPIEDATASEQTEDLNSGADEVEDDTNNSPTQDATTAEQPSDTTGTAVSTDGPALLLDCDGTLVETERDGHRVAFNQAFKQRGFDCEWDVELYGDLLTTGGGKERMTRYFLDYNPGAWPHLDPPSKDHPAIQDLHELKTKLFMDIVESGELKLREGILDLLTAATDAGWTLAVCSTSNEKAVAAVVKTNLPQFASNIRIFAGDVVSKKKPDPAIYNLAASELGLDPKKCIVVEDTDIGLRAGKAAGMTVVVTRSIYSENEDFTGADFNVANAEAISFDKDLAVRFSEEQVKKVKKEKVKKVTKVKKGKRR